MNIALSQPRGNHVIYKVVRDELTLIHQGLCRFAQLGTIGNIGAENVTGRYLRNTELRHEELRLSAFSDTGRA